MTGSAVQCHEATALPVAGPDLLECGLSPRKIRWAAKRRLRTLRCGSVSGDAETPADRAPDIQRFTVRLVPTEEDKSKKRRDEDYCGKRDPADPSPWIIVAQRSLAGIHGTVVTVDCRVISKTGTDDFRAKNCPMG